MSLHYIIDGYNLIKHPLFKSPNRQKGSPADKALGFIQVNRLTGSPKNKLTVVFDGYPPSVSCDALNPQNASIIFSRKISADEKIKNLVENSAARKTIFVISDDKEIKSAVKFLGARILGVAEFIQAKEKNLPASEKEDLEKKLTFSSMHKINEELTRLWLK